MERKLSNSLGLLTIISIVLYTYFLNTVRADFFTLLAVYAGLFACFFGFIYVTKLSLNNQIEVLPSSWGNWFYGKPVIGGLFITGLVIRLFLMQYTPNLSQDFFRFIWDGHQLLNGFNPYLYLPDEIVANGASHIPNADFLHASMGSLSSGHFTNYPPLNQLFFAIAAYLGGDSMLATIVWMRVFIILADVGVFIYGIKLLRLLGRPLWMILLYYLNPFVIIELTGNLHWEGMMAFFLLASIYYLFKYSNIKSAVFMGYAIVLKLLPLITLPLLLKRLWFKKVFIYYIAVLVVIILAFAPFLSADLLEKYGASVGLWFGNFEFNASIYYIVRAICYEVTGYNIIGVAGKVLPLISFILIMIISLSRKQNQPETLLESIVLVFFTYLLFSTTVHPWYLVLPLLFSVFTRYRFMLVWSFMIILSYYAYSDVEFQENLWLVGLQYVVVIAMFLWDTLSYFDQAQQPQKQNNSTTI